MSRRPTPGAVLQIVAGADGDAVIASALRFSVLGERSAPVLHRGRAARREPS